MNKNLPSDLTKRALQGAMLLILGVVVFVNVAFLIWISEQAEM